MLEVNLNSLGSVDLEMLAPGPCQVFCCQYGRRLRRQILVLVCLVSFPTLLPAAETARPQVFAPIPCVDHDGDGFGSPGDPSCPNGSAEDCDDCDPSNFPGNVEICDGFDNDCDALADFPDELVDLDGDGSPACVDCDDGNAVNFPGNPEICDGVDNDCDGHPEDGFADSDGDGVSVCAGDCDDNDANNFPGNVEICDGQDNDCNGLDDVLGFDGSETDDDCDGFSECEGDTRDNDPRIIVIRGMCFVIW